ncbi:MAG: LemA family protein [bacterium]|nr:LemA family protein [bacterium]
MELLIIPLLVPLAIILVVGLWIAFMYNNLVRARNNVDESWSDIDTELKRRYNLIPNLVETVKGYASHEKETLDNVIQARNKAMANNGTPAEQAQDENVLVGGLRQLFALAESYPDLKANQNFLELQQELSNTEDRIQRSRRFYNGNVRDMNNMVQTFPSNVIANMFNFQTREYFELEDEAMREVPKVAF